MSYDLPPDLIAQMDQVLAERTDLLRKLFEAQVESINNHGSAFSFARLAQWAHHMAHDHPHATAELLVSSIHNAALSACNKNEGLG